jgi:Fuc2NAc and GlcNAc transferase
MVIVLTYFICFLYPRFAKRLNFLASANARSAHTEPTPTGAGIVFSFFSFIFFWLCISLGDDNPSVILAFLASMFVGVIGFIDDIYELSVKVRLPLYALAAIWCVGWVGLPNLGLFAFDSYLTIFGGFVAIVFLLWIQNLFNFMDGIDGLAASMGVIGFLAMSFVNAHNGQTQLAAINSIVAFSCLGFLMFNSPPAKIFLGDVGSASLGYLMAVSIVLTTSGGLSDSWPPLLIFAPFLLDATFTIARRALSGEKFWTAHRSHLYQRLALRVGSRGALLIYMTWMLVNVLVAWSLIKEAR